MSTGKRLAKRSIIGTRVCAPGPDGLWYSGVIQDVKIPPNKNSQTENNNCINLTPDTRYIVRFDLKTHYHYQQQLLQQQQQQRQLQQAIVVNNNLKNSQQQDEDQEMMDTTTVTTTRITSTGNVIHHQQPQQQQQFVHHPQQIHHHPIQSRPDIMLSPAQSIRRNAMIKEFRDTDLIGPGFRSMIGVQLHPGQRVFLTYNGREISGEVKSHDLQKDEVWVKITPIGHEEPLELKKRLEEVRLLESRRSARLADQDRDTDFARLADMAGDRRRTSHSIDVPLALTQHNSRKRRPSYSQEYRENFITQFRDDDQMDACNAALVLMSLSCSPRSPRQWNTILGSSPGSSSASWSSSGTSSPPLSDDGTNLLNGEHRTTNARIRTASLSTSDEGIVMDYSDDAPHKRRAHGPIFQCTWKGCGVVETTVAKIELHVRNAHLGPKKPRHSFDDDGAFSDSDHEEEFYYTEIEEEDDEGKAPSPPSPPTLSHRDMARPPHEDPEYQRQIVGNFRQGLLALSQNSNSVKTTTHHNNLNNNNNNNNNNNSNNNNNNNAGPITIPTSPLAHHNYTWHSPVSPVKHARWSPRPSTSSAPYPSPTHIHHHYNNNNNNNNNTINHPPPQQQQNGLIIPQNAANLATLSHSASTTTTTQNHYVTPVPVTINHPQNNMHNHHHQQVNQHHHPHLQQQQQHLPTPQQQHTVVIPAAAVAGTNIMPTAGGTITGQPAALTQTVATNHRSPQSPNRRTRGDNKKCRKVYGMDNKDQWCTQCKWKKACSRFGD